MRSSFVEFRHGPRLAGFALAFLIVFLLAAPARAQITFPSAAPISAGNVIVRTQPTMTQGSGGTQSFYDENVVLYGASPDLAFILENKSIVSNSANIVTNGKTAALTATGFGDTVLDTRYNLYEVDGIGSTFRVAPYIGVDLPTGMDNANATMPRELQPASAAWGTREALTASWQTLFWNAQALIGYQDYTSSGDFQPGNALLADAAFHYMIWPSDLDREVPTEIFASLESNYSLSGVDRMNGMAISGTGGQLWTVDPGIIYSTPKFAVDFTALLPILQQYRGPGATRYDYGLQLMFRYSFFTYHHW